MWIFALTKANIFNPQGLQIFYEGYLQSNLHDIATYYLVWIFDLVKFVVYGTVALFLGGINYLSVVN